MNSTTCSIVTPPIISQRRCDLFNKWSLICHADIHHAFCVRWRRVMSGLLDSLWLWSNESLPFREQIMQFWKIIKWLILLIKERVSSALIFLQYNTDWLFVPLLRKFWRNWLTMNGFGKKCAIKCCYIFEKWFINDRSVL